MTRSLGLAGMALLGIVVAGVAQQSPTRTPSSKPKQPAATPAQPARPAQPSAGSPAPAAPSEQAKPATAAPAAENAREADESQIIEVIKGVDKAFNEGDAKALAALFTAEAEIVDEEGQATQGREAIQQVFAGLFEEFPDARLETEVQSLRFVGATLAIEEGATAATYDPAEPPVHNRYVVVHVKENGKWQMASARDYPQPESEGDEQLQQLAWLIGEWVDESEDSLVLTSYAWEDNAHYIVSKFQVQIAGRPAMSGTQRIGWDPLARQIRSWVFDSEGGFAEGLWTRDGNRWMIKQRGITEDARVASSTNVVTQLSQDRMTWQSWDRVVGGERSDDIEEVLVVRRPPKPAAAE